MADTAPAFPRDKRGEWVPEELPKPGPAFSRPWQIKRAINVIFGFEGVLGWQSLVYIGLTVVSWLFLTPDVARMRTLGIGWIAELYLRNAALLLLIAGTLHLRLYVLKAQGDRYKFNARFPQAGNSKFLFGSQTWDNVFWCFVSGVTIWTAFEALSLWAYANGILPWVEFRTNPVYCLLLFPFINLFRQVHFYWTHRLTHWKPYYRAAHYVHHKNVSPGPWSGFSMHPLEHLIYLSGFLLHWILPSHPIHMVYHLLHAGLTPANGHSGFHRVEVRDKPSVKSGDYFHYLHHRYFDCNYGNEGVPLDKWFGSFHDGSPEAHEAMRGRHRRIKLGRKYVPQPGAAATPDLR
ncbi:MAG: sterol desaturase family protein [Spirochaetaceae bacterium]|nr:sterol desaturase family protein [Spirochaetaceae bacterium]